MAKDDFDNNTTFGPFVSPVRADLGPLEFWFCLISDQPSSKCASCWDDYRSAASVKQFIGSVAGRRMREFRPPEEYLPLPTLTTLGGTPPVTTKPSNPKDAISGSRVPMDVVPDTARIAIAMALFEGALKYGKHNWRVVGVRASVYKSAFERHWMAWWNGEDIDTESGLPHLFKAIACLAIIIDADVVGKLTDDRPPVAPVGQLLKDLQPKVLALQEMHKDKKPKHYSIKDTP